MDEALEKLIDEAGRDRVFSEARMRGWSAFNSPPSWAWRQIAYEILAKQKTPDPA